MGQQAGTDTGGRETEGMKKFGNLILRCVFMMSVTLGVILGCLLYLKSRSPEPVYEYVSMSEEAAARAFIWLNQIEDMPLSYAQIKEIMGDIRLKLMLMPTGEKGSYQRTLAEDTFMDCEERAQTGLEKAYRQVAGDRLFMAGYEGEVSDGELDAMMQEIYGVSVSEYLSYCEVQLLPTLEELTELYTGEVADEEK